MEKRINPSAGFRCAHSNNLPEWPDRFTEQDLREMLRKVNRRRRRKRLLWLLAALAAAILLLSCSKEPDLPEPPPKDREYWQPTKTPVEIG